MSMRKYSALLIFAFALASGFGYPVAALVYILLRFKVSPDIWIIVLGLIILFSIQQFKMVVNYKNIAFFVILSSYIILSNLIVSVDHNSNIDTKNILRMLIFIFIAYFLSNFKLTEKVPISSNIINFSLIIAVLIYSIGFLQYYSNEPIFIEAALAGFGVDFKSSTTNPIWIFDGHVRAFSLFPTSGWYAAFILLIFTLSAYSYARLGRKPLHLFIALLSIFSMYTTLTRTGFIGVLISVLSIYFCKKAKKVRLAGIFLINIFIYLSIFFFSSFYSSLSNEKIADSESLVVRIANWSTILKNPIGSDLNTWFGLNLTQNQFKYDGGRLVASDSIGSLISDNSLISVYLYGGVLLALFFLLFITVQLYRVNEKSEQSEIGKIGLVISISLLSFNIFGNLWWIAIMMPSLTIFSVNNFSLRVVK